MFGVNKCFGGSSWGVVLTFNEYDAANKACELLKVKSGGLYEVVNMNTYLIPNDESYIEQTIEALLKRWY